MHKECFRAINRLRKNDDIIVTTPEKGSGVVLLNKSDYVDKMNKILDDQSKFRRFGPVSSNDNTASIESRLQKRLLDFVKADLMPKLIYDPIRPTGSQRPRMYGLPKTHKEGTPLRPILSMTGSSHHELGKWLASQLQPVLERFSSHCISDSFKFAKTMQNLDIDPNVFMCSFDVFSLFTNVPLDETIKICSEALYDQSNSRPVIPMDVFVELMKSTPSSLEFSFNNTMYKQTDGVAMGSPLGPALANIFVGYYEEKLFSQVQKPPIYFRYVDDTFAIFDHEAEADEFLTKLNCLHPSLKFTFEKKKGKYLPFLDVYVETTDVGLETSVHRKPTFIGQYLRWESFSPLKRKISLISTLVHRALMICTKRRLNQEIERIKKILLDNGYPKNIKTQITKEITQFSTLKRFGPEKCPVYLRVPWIGKPSTNLEKEVQTVVESCCGSVSTRLAFTTKRMLPVARKDVLPTIQKSFVIYEYKCHCDSRYVGRTSQRLQNRIKQYVLQWLRQQLTRPRRSQPHISCKRTDTKPDCDSAIDQHLLDNDRCALNYDNKRFSILAAARSFFHLNLLEATYIKTRRPVLCRQKEFVYTLKLFR